MKKEAPEQEQAGLDIEPLRCPGSLKGTAKALNRSKLAVASHQKGALMHALHCGALLHYAKSLVEHGEWLPWVEKNFGGSVNRAGEYMLIARAYSQDSGNLNGCESIESALQVARGPLPGRALTVR